ncbi:von Willebrand factor A domain-containing protein 7-like [Dendronephthya gigantea]|uniref:von Willebrand factor A domain-containing protein 7-like n=1 Tax=Dendronephthya gigantea TaxID=151771 RepID=UPI00106CDC47|nr:von Willebrand factor A domain-containing protein 7-like [Dendronephthya gigantea]
MKMHFCFLLLLVGFSAAFIPNLRWKAASGAWSSLNHKIITRAGLWLSVIEFLKENPKTKTDELARVDTARLLEGKVSNKLYRLVKSPKFEDAVKEIENANAKVDKYEQDFASAHFDAEQFRASCMRLMTFKKEVIALIQKAGDDEVDYTVARKTAGKLLHTLQDFYSHSNWVESGSIDPLSMLGDEIISESYIAGADVKTCRDCTPVGWKRPFGIGADDCQNNLVNTGKLTSGYYGGQDVTKPVGVGKCSHGGFLDKSRHSDSKGGINKDSTLRYLSPHYRLHQPAARVAIKATKLFFDSIRKHVGDENFSKFLNMKALNTLTFAIDTTGSMSDEIAGVKKATIQFIEDAAADDHHDFRYVLVPFNDPGFGPAITTDDPEVAKQAVNSLTANGGGDCPEMGMNGLYLAVLNSLPDSDIYYFSDASAKDAYLVHAVISVSLLKQCRIYLFINSYCSSRRRRSLSARDVYKQLASQTGGQLIQYSKSNIDEAIKLVRPANVSSEVKSLLREVTLISVEANAVSLVTKLYNVHCDSSIASMTAVLSAAGNTNVKVVRPKDGNGTIDIISQTSTFYSVRVIMPTPGVWNFTITASGSFTFKVTAQSALAFTTSLEKEEYSSTFEKILVPVTGNPIKGLSLYVTVEPTENVLTEDRSFTGYLIDTRGDYLERFELQKGEEFFEESYYGSFQAKHDAFRIMYIGYGKNGETIQRVQPPVIRPQEFEVEISVQNRSLSLTPNETTSIIVVLKNYGPNNTFSIQVSDDKSFVVSYSPKIVAVRGNDSVNIHIDFLAPSNTNDSTTTSVSVSASIQYGLRADLANFISFEVSVFSKEFRFVNETLATSKQNISSLLNVRQDDGESTTMVPSHKATPGNVGSANDGFPMYRTILIVAFSKFLLV